jgi:hypothetical protein
MLGHKWSTQTSRVTVLMVNLPAIGAMMLKSKFFKKT